MQTNTGSIMGDELAELLAGRSVWELELEHAHEHALELVGPARHDDRERGEQRPIHRG